MFSNLGDEQIIECLSSLCLVLHQLDAGQLLLSRKMWRLISLAPARTSLCVVQSKHVYENLLVHTSVIHIYGIKPPLDRTLHPAITPSLPWVLVDLRCTRLFDFLSLSVSQALVYVSLLVSLPSRPVQVAIWLHVLPPPSFALLSVCPVFISPAAFSPS